MQTGGFMITPGLGRAGAARHPRSGAAVRAAHAGGRRPGEASRPRFERWEGNPDAWLRNLRDAKVTHLFVSVLSAYEIGYVRHNEAGFPIEDDWAKADPGAFALLYENGQVKVYAVAQP